MEFSGFTFRDGLLAGVMIGVWWSNFSRRDMGRRVGGLEQDVRELLALLRPTRDPIIPPIGGSNVR